MTPMERLTIHNSVMSIPDRKVFIRLEREVNLIGSETAKQFSDYLGLENFENFEHAIGLNNNISYLSSLK